MSTNEHLTKKLISIVVPIYCEEGSLRLLIERLDFVTGKLVEFDFHYVLVNDGSKDGSWELIKNLLVLLISLMEQRNQHYILLQCTDTGELVACSNWFKLYNRFIYYYKKYFNFT